MPARLYSDPAWNWDAWGCTDLCITVPIRNPVRNSDPYDRAVPRMRSAVCCCFQLEPALHRPRAMGYPDLSKRHPISQFHEEFIGNAFAASASRAAGLPAGQSTEGPIEHSEVAYLCPAKQFPTMTAFLELLPDVLIKRSGALAHHPAPHFGNKPNCLLALASNTTRNIGVPEVDQVGVP